MSPNEMHETPRGGQSNVVPVILRWIAVLFLSCFMGWMCFAAIQWLKQPFPHLHPLIAGFLHQLGVALQFTLICAAITLVIGGVANAFFFRRDPDDPDKFGGDPNDPATNHAVASPTPSAFEPAAAEFGWRPTEAQPRRWVSWLRRQVSRFGTRR